MSLNQNTKRVGIWIRVSTEDQVKGESPEHHEKRARLYAEAKGWEVVTVYRLNAISGKTVKETAQAQQMMQDVASGEITGLIFSKLARLARNTKELLEFSDFFGKHNAELISLGESIDTSTAAGRLFYTIVAAMATWERDEIASRVAASVPIRAQLGKNIGGAAQFGYQWIDGKISINEKEATVRREMYDIFLKCERIKTTAKIMNERGYRTRRGDKFSDHTVMRLLRDPIAKGTRVVNRHKTLGDKAHWKFKSKEDWIEFPAEAMISEEKWNLVQAALNAHSTGPRKQRAKMPVHLFAGLLHCGCGGKMYVKTSSPKKYVCVGCNSKIPIADIEAIYHEQLRNFYFSPQEISNQLDKATKAIADKTALLAALEKELSKISNEINRLHELFAEGMIDKTGFRDRYNKVAARKMQLDEEVPTLQAEVDALKIAQLSSEEIITGAKDLFTRWPTLALEERRRVVEAITKRITVGDEDIEIDLLYEPDISPPDRSGGGGGASSGGSGRSPLPSLNGGKFAMNPCADGYLGAQIAAKPCRCTPDQIARYRNRISGPLLDRIDLHVVVPMQGHEFTRAPLEGEKPSESSAKVRERVMAAHERALARQGGANAMLGVGELATHCALDSASENLLAQAAQRLGLSVRAQHRILRVARTIADLESSDALRSKHLAEALGYRQTTTN